MKKLKTGSSNQNLGTGHNSLTLKMANHTGVTLMGAASVPPWTPGWLKNRRLRPKTHDSCKGWAITSLRKCKPGCPPCEGELCCSDPEAKQMRYPCEQPTVSSLFELKLFVDQLDIVCCVCVCACARACVRACVRLCAARACLCMHLAHTVSKSCLTIC